MTRVQKFNAAVTPVRCPGGWGVSIEISDPAAVVSRTTINKVVFTTSELATEVGWRMAESQIRRLMDAR
jgi:hypothetical protein